jgi:uncharacterized membrane protein YkvA (DUF1232 family)
VNALKEIIDLETLILRKQKADALRALRKFDRPLARLCRKRWKSDDQMASVMATMMIYGSAAYRIVPEDLNA